MQHDKNHLNIMKGEIKIFDANGNVCEDSVVALRQILSFDNVTIFFYDDETIQIMVENQVMYDLPLYSM